MVKTHRQRCGFKQLTMVVQNLFFWKNADLASEHGKTDGNIGNMSRYEYGSIPINTIFSGMNIHLPAILGFTRYQGFDPSPYNGTRNIYVDLVY